MNQELNQTQSSTPKKQYFLPTELLVALSTSRPQIATMLRNQIAAGKRTLSADEQVAVLDLLVSMVADKAVVEYQDQRAQVVLEQLEDALTGLQRKREELVELLTGAREGKVTPDVPSVGQRKRRGQEEVPEEELYEQARFEAEAIEKTLRGGGR